MKRFIFGSLSVLLVAASTPALAAEQVHVATTANMRTLTPSLQNLGSISTAPKARNPQVILASAQDVKNPATGMTVRQEIAMLTKNKGQFGSGDQLRRYFFGDLEPLGVQPGGAGMVVNLYNKANNMTFSYCATYDVVVAIKPGRVTTFLASEVK